MKYGILILLSIMLFRSNNEIIVDELGYRLSVPENYKNDRLRGGTYLWIKVDGSTKAGIQRWPTTFTYDDFKAKMKNFNPWHEGTISEGTNSEEIHKVIIDQNENYFKYIQTKYYNFYLWGETIEILKTLIAGLIIDEEILRDQFSMGVDYPIGGKEIIELANRQNVFYRDSVNIFQMNIDTSYYINPYLMISEGNMENRYQNIYSLTEIPNHVNSIKISINASDKTGTDQLNYRKEFKVK